MFLVTDTSTAAEPVAAVTGDFVFVGDVGRPDLLERAAGVTGTMESAARALYGSLKRLAALPDYLQIWPGHGAGSACGKALGAVPQSTLGYEKLANWALRITDREEFITEVLAGQPEPPTYFAAMKRLNRSGPAILGRAPSPPHLPPSALARALASGARVVDLRPTATFAEGFIPGTINIPLSRSFVSYAGWLIDVDQEVYFVSGASDDAIARAAASELSMIGIDRVSGWFGADTLGEAGSRETLDVFRNLKPSELAAALTTNETQTVDVRALDEWSSGHIQGALHIPLGQLERRSGELDPSRPVVAVCATGSRSAIAASLLKARGFGDVANLRGGQVAWSSAGLPSATEGLVDVHG